jgi:hypothetical protein
LLRAGAAAVLRRAAHVFPPPIAAGEAAAPDQRPPTSPRLTDLLFALLESSEAELLADALQRTARAGLRLAPHLLPLALDQSASARRELLKPVLGVRGTWLARRRPEWAWALAAAVSDAELPADFEDRWLDGNAAERRGLLGLMRRLDPGRGRALVLEAWKHEKAEQRLAFVELLGPQLSAADEPALTSMLNDRSAGVRVAAARLLWRLPESELAQRVVGRARSFVAYTNGAWRVRLPPEPFDPAWEREGLTQTPPAAALGKRQWWLLQLMAAVPPDLWLPSPASSRAQLLAAARAHEFGAVLLDGISQAALTHDGKGWYAPLWDAWTQTDAPSALPEQPQIALTARLTPEEIAERADSLLAQDRWLGLLAHLPRPWPEALARRFLAAARAPRPAYAQAFVWAALGIPVELLPELGALPETQAADYYAARAFQRALEQFHDIAALRRSIAEETPL